MLCGLCNIRTQNNWKGAINSNTIFVVKLHMNAISFEPTSQSYRGSAIDLKLIGAVIIDSLWCLYESYSLSSEKHSW